MLTQSEIDRLGVRQIKRVVMRSGNPKASALLDGTNVMYPELVVEEVQQPNLTYEEAIKLSDYEWRPFKQMPGKFTCNVNGRRFIADFNPSTPEEKKVEKTTESGIVIPPAGATVEDIVKPQTKRGRPAKRSNRKKN